MKVLIKHLVSIKSVLIFISLVGITFMAKGQKPQQPSIMIIPSDNQLKRLNCLDDTTMNQGQQVFIRHYQRAFVNHAELKFVINAIAGKFADRGFPLESMEQSLKQIQNNKALDIADGVVTDTRSQLLNTARPDIILELTYQLKNSGMGKLLVFDLSAIDAYTMEIIGSATHDGFETIESNIEKLMAEQVEHNTHNLQTRMNNHFKDLSENGRKITLRVTVKGNSDLTEYCDALDEEYSFIIHDWVRKNSIGKNAKKNGSTDTQVRYSNIRIPMYDDEGYPMAATDWVRLLRKYLRKNCKVKSKDRTTGLGGGVLMLTFD